MGFAFFRDAHGRPNKSNDGANAPIHILKRLGEGSSVTDGGISWKLTSYREYDTVLRSSFLVQDAEEIPLNDHDAENILWKAINSLVKKSPGKPVFLAPFLKEANRLAKEFYEQPQADYTLVTSLSTKTLPARSITIRGSAIKGLKQRLPKYPLPDLLVKGSHTGIFADHLKSTEYQHVTVSTTGRSVFEAVDRGLDAVHLLRGLWALFGTFGQTRWNMGGPNRRRIGIIHTGPVHTIHLPDGTPAIDMYWYDDMVAIDQPLFDEKKDWFRIESNRKWATRCLSRLPFRREAEALLIRYAIALDQADYNVAFLQMWSILERIANTVGKDYDKTIDKMLRIYAADDRPVFREMLEVLRYRRNQYVHSGGSDHEPDRTAYLLKSILDPHLLRVVANPFKVGKLEEHAEYLSLPVEIDRLERRVKMFSRALRSARMQKKHDDQRKEKPLQE